MVLFKKNDADAKECRIYRAQIMYDTDTIKFPNEINGIAVTKIGATSLPMYSGEPDSNVYFIQKRRHIKSKSAQILLSF